MILGVLAQAVTGVNEGMKPEVSSPRVQHRRDAEQAAEGAVDEREQRLAGRSEE